MKKLASYRFDQHTLDDIKCIGESLGIKNDTAVCRKALTLLEAVTKNQQEGGCLVLVDGDGNRREVVFT